MWHGIQAFQEPRTFHTQDKLPSAHSCWTENKKKKPQLFINFSLGNKTQLFIYYSLSNKTRLFINFSPTKKTQLFIYFSLRNKTQLFIHFSLTNKIRILTYYPLRTDREVLINTFVSQLYFVDAIYKQYINNEASTSLIRTIIYEQVRCMKTGVKCI